MSLDVGRLRVLEVADTNVAYCGRLLASFGAEVVLIEPPGGAPLRTAWPIVRHGPLSGISAAAAYLYMGTRSLTLNLSTEDGRDLFRALARQFDVVLEGGRPGRMAAWGLDYESLQGYNPRLIMTSITPFGQSGPYRDFIAPPAVAFAMGGLMSLSGPSDGPPVMSPGDQGMIVAGAHAASAVLTALRARTRTGRGQFVDVSMQAAFAAQENLISTYNGTGQSPQRVGSQHRVATPGRVYKCQDGWIHLFVSPAQHGAWERLLEWMGYPVELSGDMWQNARYRRAHVEVVDAVVGRWIAEFHKQAFYEEAQRRKIPCAPVNQLGEFLHDTHTQSRNFVGSTSGPSSYPYLVSPWMIDGQRDALSALPPIGEANDTFFREMLELSTVEMAALKGLQVI